MKLSKLLFGFEGRLNRAPYWGYTILASILLNVLVVGLAMSGSSMLMQLSMLLYIPYLWIIFAILVKRLHDLDKNGWLSLLWIVPIANLYLFIIAGFFKGTEGKNQYGENPLNSTSSSTGTTSSSETASISNSNEL